MATNDFYYGNRPPSTGPSQSQSPYSGAAYMPSPASTTAPPYSSSNPVPDTTNRPPRSDTVSPFDTVFDDNAYPTDSTQNGFRPSPYGSSTTNMMQQPTPYGHQDTAYYGPGSSATPVSNLPPQAHFADDIPLQNHGHEPNQPHKDVEMNDHVYDVPGSQRRKKSKKVGFGQLGMFGADKKRIPWVVYFFTAVQIGVFIGQLVRNGILTGTPIMIKPSFNPMIGPSYYVNVNMGARYVPCMHIPKEIKEATIPIYWPCPNTTNSDPLNDSNRCSLGELCGFGGVPDPQNPDEDGVPNQWFRFITPIFLHAGLIHIAVNMLLQLTIAKEMEMAIGPIRFFLVYISAGIFGNIMGANFAGSGEVSQGASGALFGIIALTLLDLLYSWKERRSPIKDLLFIIIDIAVCFVLGLLPGLDNFAHIGGFLMGLCLGICVLHSPNSLRKRLGYETSYATVSVPANEGGAPPFMKNPTGFFKGRKPLWWIWWIIRAAALILVIVVFIVLLNNFYVGKTDCSWCRRLSCLPVSNWCEMGDLSFEEFSENPSP
ncbi:hypothetical protein ACRALDRAFT_1062860 [Sodiomyces alcalophilus JCM 7366]|uniref:uncharacterized protein n=1 Tax=Sodiomyces alcalophilus JCM 7366 TaxID=591952 RepID=UPI0039B560FA